MINQYGLILGMLSTASEFHSNVSSFGSESKSRRFGIHEVVQSRVCASVHYCWLTRETSEIKFQKN